MIRPAGVAALVLAACVVASPAAQAAEDARAWLKRMSTALATANYVGEFELQGAGYSEKLRIYHRVRDGRVSERLVTLSGRGREMIRDGDEVTAFLPDRQLAIIERRPDRGGLLGTLPRYDGELEQWYELELVGMESSLNGRPAAHVRVRPRDGYRFGHRLWIDSETAMPVRTELCDRGERIVERLSFTRLELRADIADAELQPSVDPASFRWVRQVGRNPAASLPWQVRAAPPGFRLSVSNLQEMLGVPAPVSHLVLSDGLASVSVFIHAPAPGQQPARGLGRAGAASTFSTVVDGHQVTAMGEVPPDTLEAIARGVVRAGADER